jgi:hypothetical protein
MLNLIIAGVITTLIIGYRCVKRWVDTKCQENFDVGVTWGIELHKIEMELESNEIYRKIVVKK